MSKYLEIQEHSWRKPHKPEILRPKCIGSYSLDGNRKFHPDKRNLKFVNTDLLQNEFVSMNLDDGIEKTIVRDPYFSQKEKLDHILQWILCNKSKFTDNLPVDFVLIRGLLTKLMFTPYERNDEWIMHAIKWNGTIHLMNIFTDSHLQYLADVTEKDIRMSAWGHKFEQYMTSFSSTSESTNEPVDQNTDYICVLRSLFGNHSLVYAAEVDGADVNLYKEPHEDLSAFIELKTTNRIVSQRNVYTLRRFKMIKWFCQSYVTGLPTLICGYKDGNRVNRLEKFDVNKLPSLCKRFWSRDVMLDFLNRFLYFVKSIVVEERPVIYEFRTALSSNRIYAEKVTDAEDFLPDWYTQELLKK